MDLATPHAAHRPHAARDSRGVRGACATAVLLLVLCGTLTPSVVAQDASAGTPDPRALTARLLAHYAEHPELAVTIEQVLDVPAVPALHQEARYRAAVARTGRRLSLRHVRGEPELSVVVDGARMLFVGADGHLVAETPASLARLARDERLGRPLPALALLVDVLSGEVVDADAPVEYVAREELGGRVAHHLRFSSPSVNDVWIDAGEQPFILRWMPALPDVSALPEGVSLEHVMRMDVRFSDWRSGPAPDGTFSLAPPEGSGLVLSLAPTSSVLRSTADDARDAARGTPAAEPGEGTAAPRADASTDPKLAPDVTLVSLDGSSRRLSELRGQVVVLDFWASWCKPCLQGLPILDEVVDDLAARGVSLYAVNVREAPAKITDFLEKRGVNWPVVLDRDGAIAKAYGVSPIPHTVIIGRDGRVFDVHVGFDDGLAREFRGKLERALAK